MPVLSLQRSAAGQWFNSLSMERRIAFIEQTRQRLAVFDYDYLVIGIAVNHLHVVERVRSVVNTLVRVFPYHFVILFIQLILLSMTPNSPWRTYASTQN